MNEMRSDYLYKSSLPDPPNLGLAKSGLQQILFLKIFSTNKKILALVCNRTMNVVEQVVSVFVDYPSSIRNIMVPLGILKHFSIARFTMCWNHTRCLMEHIQLLPHPGLECGRFTHIMAFHCLHINASLLPIIRQAHGVCQGPMSIGAV